MKRTAATLALATLWVGTAQAQGTRAEARVRAESGTADRYATPGDRALTRRVSLAVGKSFIADLPTDAAEVFVATPGIANAIIRTARRLYVVGNANGQTSIYVMDKDGTRIAIYEVTVGRDVAELREILRTALPGAPIDVKTVNDTIILTGTVDSAVDAQKAADIADAFVGYTVVGGGGSAGAGGVSFNSASVVRGKLINSLVIRGRDQVMVKVTIAEVQRQVVKQLGVSPNGSWSSGSFGGGNNLTNPVFSTNAASAVVSYATGFGRLGGTLAAFERQGVARVLAEPTVVAISGETGRFVAGGEVPTATQVSYTPGTATSAATCDQTYILKKYGISLGFTPIVLSEGRIQMHVNTEVTEVDPSQGPTNSPCANIPGFRTRANETTVELPSGGSIASAGLIQQRSRQLITGKPALMNLPILGALFRSRDFQREETELMIIMTPYIVKPTSADKLARPDDGFADASDPQSVFLGRVNRLYATKRNPEILQNFKGRVGFIND